MTQWNGRAAWQVLLLPSAGRRFVYGSGPTMRSLDATTGEVVAEVATSTQEDVDAAVHAARTAFAESPWRHDGTLRARALALYATKLREHSERLAEILSRAGQATF